MKSFPARRNTLVLSAVVFILAVFAWAGWANWEYRKQAAERSLAEVAQGELVPAPGSGTPQWVSLLNGKPAPAFALEDLSGKKVTLTSYRGKAVLINFWATQVQFRSSRSRRCCGWPVWLHWRAQLRL